MDIGVIKGQYWGYTGIMEKNMETIIMGYIGFYIGCRKSLNSSS